MKLFGFNISRKTELTTEEMRSIYDYTDPIYGSLTYGNQSSFRGSKALTLSAVYRSVNLIGDAIASLAMKTYSVDADGYKKEDTTNPLYDLLTYEPNPTISRFTFFKNIISSMLLRGNAYVRIVRDKSFKVEALNLLNPDAVTIVTLNGELKYKIAGVIGYINAADMIHVLNFPQFNSFYGVSTIQYGINSLDRSYNSENHASNWFKGGANSAGVMSFDEPLSPKQEKDLLAKMKAASDAETGNPNGLVFLGGAPGAQFHTFGVSPRDSQLLESRAFNVVDIARFFSVNPILLFDNTKATYSNVESSQLDFLNTTLLPIIEKLENEFVRKLILPSQRSVSEIRFELSNILRTDMKSQATYYKELFSMGVVNANQIAKFLNLPKIEGEGGDTNYISTNLQDTNNLIVNQDNSLDNKLK